MRRSVIRDRRGVTEIGRKLEGSLGCFVFGTGVIIALFHSIQPNYIELSYRDQI